MPNELSSPPWAWEELEILESKIIGVPRLDVIVNSAYDASVLRPFAAKYINSDYNTIVVVAE
ncbi:hypothetical protein BGZ97_005712, partial [Linnemannia gamsii]